MWRPDSWLLGTDGSERAALTWLQCYMAGVSDCAVPDYVPEPRTGDSAGIQLEAEDFDATQGLLAAGSVVAYADPGDWLRFDRVVFDANWDSLSATYANGGSAAASAVNLVPDGTFESGIGSWFGWNNTNLTVVDTYAHSGASSLASIGRAANGSLARDFTSLVAAGETHQATFWVSVSELEAGAGDVNVTTAIDCGSGAAYNWLGQVSVPNGEWRSISGTLDLSACETLSSVMLFAEGTTSGNLYVDDVTLVKN